MKTNKRFILGILAFAATLLFTACSDDDKDNGNGNGGNEQPESEEVTAFDDLSFFQNGIIQIDSLGEMMCRLYGEVLYDSDPHHLYIGVDNLAEAERIFRQWIAPDIQLSTTIPTTSGLTCPLTDLEGRSQGTVYFMPGSGTSVAEVTASSGTDLKHFNRITFLLNSAWPVNESIYNKFTEGDIIVYSPCIGNDAVTSGFAENDRILKWVCIRSASNGVKPLFCSITKSKYFVTSESTGLIANSSFCPSTSTAENIHNILAAEWDYWVAVFSRAELNLDENQKYWVDGYEWALRRKCYKYRWDTWHNYFEWAFSGGDLPFLLKIDWLDEDALNTTLAGTDGSQSEKERENVLVMFDGKTNTHFYSKANKKTDGCWFVEFKSNDPKVTMGYKITTGWNAEKYKGRNPKTWKLYGKGDINKQWTLISQATNQNLADINCKVYAYSCTPGLYQYFRWEIYDVNGGDALQVSEFNIITQNSDDIGEMLLVTNGTHRSDGADKCEYMFSEDPSTYWYCPNEEKKDGVWFVEFYSVKPQEPTAYKLYSTYHSVGELANCHPKNWKLYGKLDEGDEWTLIDERKDEDLPHENTEANTYNITNRGEYQYYRLEVSENHGGNGVFIGRFEFVY